MSSTDKQQTPSTPNQFRDSTL